MSIKLTIERCIHFLHKEQKENGEFSTYFSTEESLDGSMFVRSPFVTTFVIHSLQFETHPLGVETTKKAISFLLNYQESDFTWKFFKDRDIPKSFIYDSIASDLDDTCCALICLKRGGYGFNEKVVQKILDKQNKNGGFTTYFKDWALPSDIDCVVNANVLYFLSLLNRSKLEKTINDLCKYLKSVVINDSFSENTLSYEHYLAFTYALSRAYKCGNQFCLAEIKNILLNKIENTRIKNPLEASLLVLTQLNFDEKPNEDLINYITESQEVDGGFESHVFFSAPRDFHGKKIYFGSRALTTALALEALLS